MLKSLTLVSMIGVSALLPSTVSASAAFQCPATNPPGGSATNGADESLAVEEPGAGGSVATAIDRLRGQGMKSGAIVDRLVSNYCARIAPQSEKSDESKAEQVRAFASYVASVVYRSANSAPEDILITVPVPTKLYDRLEQAAKTAKVSESMWTIEAIRTRLGGP